ncbi:glutathione S-transferase [Sulfuriflexus mobilis]|uniref:glutathione S-transferase n=1 Tax=Sulfuriflexus mobilis TaxID=1811807 RepID=UPI000F83F9EB|nr:glutathione S-transferase [Sulfuriflexus mobilis]
MHTALPILYSFRRCPYAIRARLGICYSGVRVALREVVLRDKPTSLLDASPKGEVPVLVLPDGKVLEESLDILNWALVYNDPQHWLPCDAASQQQATALIEENDGRFKYNLDRYKYPERYPDEQGLDYRAEGEKFLQQLEQVLGRHRYLLGEHPGIADIAILPFIRQFAYTDKDWFDQAPYPYLQQWLVAFLNSELFLSVMQKYPAWQPDDAPTWFP